MLIYLGETLLKDCTTYVVTLQANVHLFTGPLFYTGKPEDRGLDLPPQLFYSLFLLLG